MVVGDARGMSVGFFASAGASQGCLAISSMVARFWGSTRRICEMRDLQSGKK